jgi:hypothetical protein
MATSPNFSWPEPDNTDLVKNGALAIRTAVDAIDSSLGDLKGGTTNQVLTKASGTDMDFTWSTPSTSAGFADNGVLNSGMNVWQRGTSFASSASAAIYTADRWKFLRTGYGTGATVSRQATSDTTNLPFIQYTSRVQRDSGTTATTAIYLYQNFESVNSIPYAGKTVVLSFYARAGANYSSASNALNVQLISGTGTDQDALLSYTGSTSVIFSTATLTTTWQRFTFSATVGATATELGTSFNYTPVGTAGANDYFEITGVQLEIGSTATAYHSNQPTYEAELAACQRYYYLHASGGTSLIGSGSYNTSGNVNSAVIFPVQMRTTPTLVATSGTSYYQATGGGADDALNSLTIFIPSPQACQLYNNTEASGTQGYGVIMRTLNSAASVAFNAEL